MSLINEALKKAQRQRADDQVAATPAGGAPIAKRPQPRSANTVVLIAAGAVALVVISVVITVIWLNQPAKSTPTTVPPASVATASLPKPASATEATSPPIVTPTIKPPLAPSTEPPVTTKAATPPATPTQADIVARSAAEHKSDTAAPPSPASLKESTSASTDTTPSSAEPATHAPAASVPASPAVAPKPVAPPPKADERVQAFIDNVRVTGIRSSGDGSRVLMNGLVYRVNDIVDRGLGVRLIKVENDSLTFSDANGVTYVKYF